MRLIVVNCFVVFVVVAILDRFHGHDAVVVAILGLIYVAVRQVGLGISFLNAYSLFHLNKQLFRIRDQLNDPPSEEEKEEIAKLAPDRNIGQLIVNALFLGAIFLLCLLTLWTNL